MRKDMQNIWKGKYSPIIVPVIAFLVSLLWTYTGLDKLLNWKKSWNAFHNQTFPSELADSLAYAVPIIELILALMLVFHLTRWWGMIGSLLLMTIFNTYVGLVWQGAFPRVPCNCAGL
ncbi:DoxX family membrane protein [Belliella sp. DSM 111904]|uniref:DoxX family membrane protein n=1 Tax=Belliella filtrata TaxID=2923435 RepID=A0ABS9V5Q0_9BACT|nr:MauE/DoxX family redox-associated membrane protein [Belliella filtrata]MCH7411747.1 DoxX family membrane protein [Belliella filtrata]